ncbi:MAG: hypothetical protein PHQ05_06545 [Sterolibacterium sp.]|nr:hypothetical protein [Sterolibacterium sp.]
MNIPQNLPIAPLQSKAARYQLGLTQAEVIEESSLPGHKLKNFETGRFIPDLKFLMDLKGYYVGKGINLEELATGDPAQTPAAKPLPGAAMVQIDHRMRFYVSDKHEQEKVDAVLELMDTNDMRIAAVLKEPVSTGLFGGFDDNTEALQRELFGLMAMNYFLFRTLQGRSIAVPPPPEDGAQKTIADTLAAWIATGPMAALVAAEQVSAVSASAAPSPDREGEA